MTDFHAENSLHSLELNFALILQSFACLGYLVRFWFHCISDPLYLTLARKMKEPDPLFGVSAINRLKSEVFLCSQNKNIGEQKQRRN